MHIVKDLLCFLLAGGKTITKRKDQRSAYERFPRSNKLTPINEERRVLLRTTELESGEGRQLCAWQIQLISKARGEVLCTFLIAHQREREETRVDLAIPSLDSQSSLGKGSIFCRGQLLSVLAR